ncbi:ATP-binding protein [Streptomyces sp. NPDC053048]|uniref:SCO6881 family protein n=1 Tax=Streptomyces sp. NPDC053048 TaxID=3365694 RepID=UPI0037D7109B
MGICNLPLVDNVCKAVDAIDFVADPGKSITEGLGAWIAKSVGELAASAADLAAKAVDTTTKVDLNAGWFRDNYELVLPIALLVIVGTFCLQLIRAAWKRDGQALAQAFSGTLVGVMFAFGAIAFTTVALTVVDALSDGLFKAGHSSIADSVRRMIKVSQYGGMYELGWLVPTFVAIGAAVGAFLYWCVMMVRKVGILVLVTLACFAGAGGGWEVAKRWRRGWIEATATLVASKLLMTIVFLLGVSAMGKTDAKDGLAAVSDAMAGIVVMVMVLLCPYITYRFVHWAADGHGEDLHRSGGAGMAAASRTAQGVGRKAMAMSAGGGSGTALASAAPQGPPQVPGQLLATAAPSSSTDSHSESDSGSSSPDGKSGKPGSGSGSPGGQGDGGTCDEPTPAAPLPFTANGGSAPQSSRAAGTGGGASPQQSGLMAAGTHPGASLASGSGLIGQGPAAPAPTPQGPAVSAPRPQPATRSSDAATPPSPPATGN